jgi:isopentenyl diphosphate isomerase/L-lactate dehydrogenase-like FMN-dependent dehydrogenase
MPTQPRPDLAYPPPAAPPIDLEQVAAVADFEAPARDRLHPAAWAYYQGGGWDGITLAGNLEAWSAFQFRPRVLVDVSGLDLATTLLGAPVSMPIGVAPAALHGMAHPDGELATARAATAAGIANVVSTVASRTIEEVAAASGAGLRWFQLYVQSDRTISRDFVQRAEAAGYAALVVTVDLPVLGYRDDIMRIGFDPGAAAYGNLAGRAAVGGLDDVLDMRSIGFTWDMLAEIRSWSSLPLVLKGILTAEDARLAVEHGAAAVWVSNHGGRQLDRSPAAIEVLDEIVEAVDSRAEVYLDGGVRRGTDVVTALALGARAVFTARPFLYALACAGEPGVAKALAILRDETGRAMSLVGAARVGDLHREHVGASRARR